MPWDDWQLYVVTLAALWGARRLVLQFLSSSADTAGVACGGCSHCPSRAAAGSVAVPAASPLVQLGAGRGTADRGVLSVRRADR